jgi:hypothetical protein
VEPCPLKDASALLEQKSLAPQAKAAPATPLSLAISTELEDFEFRGPSLDHGQLFVFCFVVIATATASDLHSAGSMGELAIGL